MNATIQFTCPQCSQQMQLPSSAVGKQGNVPVVNRSSQSRWIPPSQSNGGEQLTYSIPHLESHARLEIPD
jgi:hypothetical protein